MPQVIFLPSAIEDLERLHQFLNGKSPHSARKAALAITQTIKVLEQHPQIGRLIEDMPSDYRELVIDFGQSGYIAKYYLDVDDVFILAIKHQKEL